MSDEQSSRPGRAKRRWNYQSWNYQSLMTLAEQVRQKCEDAARVMRHFMEGMASFRAIWTILRPSPAT
ncbi:hypothetical protein [Streptomyces griseoviridis]|uniref:hypothetical protein n=1 Tax=Streptomyces griseoviridis TaxID=45398 RepID=UPI003413A3FE